MVTIVVSPRPQRGVATSYHACVEGKTELCGWGKTPDEAVGNLIRTHSEQLNLSIKDGPAYLKN